MKNNISISFLAVVGLLAASCENWLDVTPPSEIRAEDHYSSARRLPADAAGVLHRHDR